MLEKLQMLHFLKKEKTSKCWNFLDCLKTSKKFVKESLVESVTMVFGFYNIYSKTFGFYPA